MFKRFFITLIFFLSFFIQMPGGLSNSTNEMHTDTELEIIAVVKAAVEDTRWLHVSSRREMDRVLGAYYSGPLLSELSESAWDFISVPTDWEYVTKAENCKVISLSGDKATTSVEILESDSITGVTFISRVEYFLIKTENGWKIAGANYSHSR